MSISYKFITSAFMTDFTRKILAAEENLQNKAMYAMASFIFKKVDEATPFIPVGKTRDLFQSWHIEKPIVSAAQILIEFGFTVPYAAKWHNIERVDINWTRSGSGQNYLSSKLFTFGGEAINIAAIEITLGLAK